MPIVPDTKNWTWVLDEPCPECGYDAAEVALGDVPGLVRANAAAWPAELRRDDVRDRPDDATWSPLEYGAHVRDVFSVFDGRLRRMLAEDAPAFENWDQDATALADDYAGQDPAVVAEQLLAAAEIVARRFEEVPADQVHRTGLRSDGAAFTVETLGLYFVHDPVHHLHDVSR
jgi:hypothetical protein